MYKITQIFIIPTQFIFLTGTLPIPLEESLKEKLLLKDPLVIRSKTSRSNISYQVSIFTSISIEEQYYELVKTIEVYKSQFKDSKKKIIVFCSSINEIITLGALSGYLTYYSDLEGKEQVLISFLEEENSKNQVIITTSALQEGLDYPYIPLIIYFYSPFSLIDFI